MIHYALTHTQTHTYRAHVYVCTLAAHNKHNKSRTPHGMFLLNPYSIQALLCHRVSVHVYRHNSVHLTHSQSSNHHMTKDANPLNHALFLITRHMTVTCWVWQYKPIQMGLCTVLMSLCVCSSRPTQKITN